MPTDETIEIPSKCLRYFMLTVCILIYFSQGLADSAVMAVVNGDGWDMDRPLEGDAELKLIKFDDPEGMRIKWNYE